jgi:hypothetical protein
MLPPLPTPSATRTRHGSDDRHLTAVKLGHARLNKEETPCEQGVSSLVLSQPCVRAKGFEPLTF